MRQSLIIGSLLILYACGDGSDLDAFDMAIDSVGEADQGPRYRVPNRRDMRIPLRPASDAGMPSVFEPKDMNPPDCGDGFVNTDSGCLDVNECLEDNGGCGDPQYFDCLNEQGEAPTCADIDECLTDNGGCGDPATL